MATFDDVSRIALTLPRQGVPRRRGLSDPLAPGRCRAHTETPARPRPVSAQEAAMTAHLQDDEPFPPDPVHPPQSRRDRIGSPYAVPLATLMAGALVATHDQVVLVPAVPGVPMEVGVGIPLGDAGGDSDGD